MSTPVTKPTMREQVESLADAFSWELADQWELMLHADQHDKGNEHYDYAVVERSDLDNKRLMTLYPDRESVHTAIIEAITDTTCHWWPEFVCDMREWYPAAERIAVDIKASWRGHDL